ncbi:Hint domain-containing protein [Lysobacter sp. CA196]|uniref:Hint domain-containing protein n=1 Tax=Lysobacter sp. CA196 TaxID=3455606 RepID=UPI003F8CFB16
MPTGMMTEVNGLVVAGTTYWGHVDVENLFHARGAAAPIADVGFYGDGGRSLSDYFYPRSLGGTTLEVDVGFVDADGVDLRHKFAKRGSVSTGGGGGGGGCLPIDTPVLLWDQGSKPLGDIRPGDVVMGWYVPGMVDESEPGWRDWQLPRDQTGQGVLIPVTVRMALQSTYPRHYVINESLRATYEHVFLVLRGAQWGWRAAADLRPGDAFLADDHREIRIESVRLIEEPLAVANIDVEEVDNFFFVAFGGVCVLSHNPEQKN